MEEDREYLGEAPGAESLDRWVHGTFALSSGDGGGPTDYAVTLPGVGGAQLGQVSVLLCGLTTLAHDVEIAFNGVSLGTYQWSGFEFYEVSASDVALVDGVNTLTGIGNGVAIDPGGDVHVTGATYVEGEGSNLLLRQYSSTGRLLWSGSFNGTSNGSDVGEGIAVARDGSVYVTGSTWVSGQGLLLLLQKYR